VWPSYERYLQHGGYGRHSGTVWPFISAYWGDAVLKHGRPDLFEKEFSLFTKHINQHGQCAEIYHPRSGDVYGGLQEAGRGKNGLEWESCSRQTWSASAYLRMILFGVVGLRFSSAGVEFHPQLPAGMEQIAINALQYRDMLLNLAIEGTGSKVTQFMVNGKSTEPFLPANLRGEQRIEIHLG
jgi:glycogen debranching enzyme